jgi:hypothetical protein
MGLPEEVVDHVYDFTGVDIDQQDIVIIPNPLVRSVSGREPVAVRIIDEEARLEEQAVEEEAPLQAAVPVRSERRVVRARVVDEAVVTPIIDPVVIALAAPTIVPAAEIAPIPAVAPAIAPAPVVPAPTAPIAPEIIAAVVEPIGTAGIARDIAHLIAEAATPAIAPFAPAVTAVLDPIAADITASFDPVCPAIPTIFYPVSADIAPTFNPACFDFAATVDSVRGAITATPVELIAAEIAATLHPVGPNFAAPVDLAGLNFTAAIHLVGAHFAAAVNAVGADFASAVNLLRALGGGRPGRHFTAEAARWCRAAFRCLAWRSRSGLRGRAIDSRFGAAATAFAADLRSFGTRFRTGLTTVAAPVLRFSSGGGKSEGKRSGQSRERTASSKKVQHCQYLQYRRPTTSGALRSRNYAPQTVAGMNRLVDVQKNC